MIDKMMNDRPAEPNNIEPLHNIFLNKFRTFSPLLRPICKTFLTQKSNFRGGAYDRVGVGGKDD